LDFSYILIKIGSASGNARLTQSGATGRREPGGVVRLGLKAPHKLINAQRERLNYGREVIKMKGWKTITGAIIVAIGAFLNFTGYVGLADVIMGIGASLGIIGIGHKIDRKS